MDSPVEPVLSDATGGVEGRANDRLEGGDQVKLWLVWSGLRGCFRHLRSPFDRADVSSNIASNVSSFKVHMMYLGSL